MQTTKQQGTEKEETSGPAGKYWSIVADTYRGNSKLRSTSTLEYGTVYRL